jgi:hypothetical protein
LTDLDIANPLSMRQLSRSLRVDLRGYAIRRGDCQRLVSGGAIASGWSQAVYTCVAHRPGQ